MAEARITVNLAPAVLRKEGSGFDLPIALAVLAASHQIPRERLRGHAAVGELALDGRVRPVSGVLAAAEGARNGGFERLLCAAGSAAEAALAGIEPCRCGTLPRLLLICVARENRLRLSRQTAARLPFRIRISRTSAGRSVDGAHSRSLPLEITTSCWQARRGRARRCSPAGCPASCRRSRRTMLSRSPASTRWLGCCFPGGR